MDYVAGRVVERLKPLAENKPSISGNLSQCYSVNPFREIDEDKQRFGVLSGLNLESLLTVPNLTWGVEHTIMELPSEDQIMKTFSLTGKLPAMAGNVVGYFVMEHSGDYVDFKVLFDLRKEIVSAINIVSGKPYPILVEVGQKLDDSIRTILDYIERQSKIGS